MASQAEILEIFPNEVWEEILSHVNTPADYQKISNASPHFRTLLLPRAPELLFPEVVKSYMERQEKDVSSWTPLRGACRAWKKAVDHELQREELYSKKDGICETDAVVVTTFQSVEDFTRFEQHFDSSHVEATEANPFVCRAIRIQLERNPQDDICVAICRFLTKYGKYVWSCGIGEDIVNQDVAILFYLLELPRILEWMPNLRFLQLRGGRRGDFTKRLRSLDNHPLPILQHLSQIQFCRVPYLVATRFLERNRQVSKVDARREPYSSDLDVGDYLKRLPNLTALAFTLRDMYDVQCLLEWQVRCQSVEYLWLNARLGSWQQIFHVLETCFGRSLIQLYLALPVASEDEYGVDRSSFRLTLPKLKTLKLKVATGDPLDFLLPMKNTLKQFSLNVEPHPRCEMMISELLKYRRELLKRYEHVLPARGRGNGHKSGTS